MLLELERITKRYQPDQPPVVEALSFHVQPGEIFALLGASGCGKTTTLRAIAGFEKIDSGTITLDGRTVAGPGQHLPPEQRRVGVVFQEFALFPHLNVLRNVMYGLHHLRRAERHARAMEVLDWVGMAEHAQQRPHTLSGGQQQRVAIARALAPTPSILLLDEPFNNLDPSLRAEIRQLVRNVLKDHQITALLVTHDHEEAISVSDRIGVMCNKCMAQVGASHEIYQRPSNAFVAQFVGDTNLIKGHAEGRVAKTALGPIRLNQEAKGETLLSIRPEHLRLEVLDSKVQQCDGSGCVTNVCYKGQGFTCSVQLDQAESSTVQVRHVDALPVSQTVRVVQVGEATPVDQDSPAR